MIAYAGISLTLPTPELLALLDSVYDPAELTEFTHKTTYDVPADCPPMEWGREIIPRVNQLVWPTISHRWAYGHFLVTDSQLACIRQAIGASVFNEFVLWDEIGVNTTTSTTTTTPAGVIAQFTGGSRVSFQLAIARVHPILDVKDAEKLYLVTFVDQRYFMWYRPCPTTTPATWTELFTNALTAAGVGSTNRVIEPLPGDLGVPSSRWAAHRWIGYPLPAYLDAAAQFTQRRIVWRPDGTVEVQNPDGKDSDDYVWHQVFSSRKRLGGLSPTQDVVARQPAAISVVFHAHDSEDDPIIETIALSTLTEGGTTTTQALGCDVTTSSTTSTTTTTLAAAPCSYYFGYTGEGALWGPLAFESNQVCCPESPAPVFWPPEDGEAGTTLVVSGPCLPATTTTTCAGLPGTTTTTTFMVTPMLPEYGVVTSVPETRVLLWADSATYSYPLARRLARDWYLWRLSRVEEAFTGPINWILQATSDSLVYRATAEVFDTRVLRTAEGPDNTVAEGFDGAATSTTTTTTQSCTGTAILVNSLGRWVVESSTCSCGCSPSFPADCPPAPCSRRTVPCSYTPAAPPICSTSTTTTTYVGPPTTTTTPYCPGTTTTTTPSCPGGCPGASDVGCTWYWGPFLGAVRVPVLVTAVCCPASTVNAVNQCCTVTYPGADPETLALGPANGCASCGVPVDTGLNCQFENTPCVAPPPVPPLAPCFCSGGCTYYADPFLNVWIADAGNACFGNYTNCAQPTPPIYGPCQCDFPTQNASDYPCGATVSFPCQDRTPRPPGYDPNEDPCLPPTTTSSTTTTPGCGGRCEWFAALSGDPWTLTSSTCQAGCLCAEPSVAADEDCDTAVTPCGEVPTTTSTTTSTTTTSTTTTAACSGGCQYRVCTTSEGIPYIESGPVDSCSMGCYCDLESLYDLFAIGRWAPNQCFDYVAGCTTDIPPPTTTSTTTTTTTSAGECEGAGLCVLGCQDGVITIVSFIGGGTNCACCRGETQYPVGASCNWDLAGGGVGYQMGTVCEPDPPLTTTTMAPPPPPP